MRTIIVTGGAGFIGSAVVRQYLAGTGVRVVTLDKLTYAANLASIPGHDTNPRHVLERVDICDRAAVRRVFATHRPDAVMHLAAESHVDRSIDGPEEFVRTNVLGTFVLLEEALAYWKGLAEGEKKAGFRFHHVSTDEVYGTLGPTGLFTEDTAYAPNSPYSATKAGSDHLVRAWQETFGLPVVMTNCSNNYGPYQFPEKLIPVMVIRGLAGQPLPVYGKGDNVRDWLHVEDHAEALRLVLDKAAPGSRYNIGGHNERSNLDLVHALCDLLDELAPPLPGGRPRRSLISFVTDRPGHDKRYAIDASRIGRDLGWKPRHTLETGLRDTVRWYLENRAWWQAILDGGYRADRIGLAGAAMAAGRAAE